MDASSQRLLEFPLFDRVLIYTTLQHKHKPFDYLAELDLYRDTDTQEFYIEGVFPGKLTEVSDPYKIQVRSSNLQNVILVHKNLTEKIFNLWRTNESISQAPKNLPQMLFRRDWWRQILQVAETLKFWVEQVLSYEKKCSEVQL